MDWFLYDNSLHHERVKHMFFIKYLRWIDFLSVLANTHIHNEVTKTKSLRSIRHIFKPWYLSIS